MKICTKCKQEKEDSEFYRHPDGTPRSHCKKCHNRDCSNRHQKVYKFDEGFREKVKAANLNHYKRNKEGAKMFSKIYYQSHKNKYLSEAKIRVSNRKSLVINSYGRKCLCCGENKIEFLCIDHINGGGTKERRTGLKGTAFYIHLIKNNFPEGYRVLCHNCNFSLGIYGYCPHDK